MMQELQIIFYFFYDEEGKTFSPAPRHVMDTSSSKQGEPEVESEEKKEPESKEEPAEPKTPSSEVMVLDNIKQFEEQSWSRSVSTQGHEEPPYFASTWRC